MKHATQVRFANFAQAEQRVAAYTLEQMERWTETDWNWHMREALRIQGFRTFHIREASETGVADLIVYKRMFPGDSTCTQKIHAWLELKKDNDKVAYSRDVRKAAQRQFMREHWREARNALYVMFDRKVGMLAVHQGDLNGRVKMLPVYPYAINWQEVFDHFKARRVSV